MGDFYNGNKLLSLKDAQGKPPEIIMCSGNRTAGKTFYFKRWMTRRFLEYDERFVVFVRCIDDVPNTYMGFWADIGPLCFPKKEMTQEPLLHGKAGMLLINKQPAAYVIAINDPERIKRNSALFADAQRGFFDEFQSETGKYLPNEIKKFNSIRLSIARGGAKGTHARYFPVYMCSNMVTTLNPYYEHLKVLPNTRSKFMRGNGWVLEQTFNESAAKAIASNFSTLSKEELDYATRNEYLLDKNTFVERIPGNKRCACLIRKDGKNYGIWECQAGIYYVSAKLWSDTPFVFALDNADHDESTVFITKSMPVAKYLRKAYDMGLMRFENQACRNAFLLAMAIQK